MPVQTANTLSGDSDTLMLNASNQVQALSAAATITPNNSIMRLNLSGGASYTVTIANPVFPSASAGNESPVLLFVLVVETNTISATFSATFTPTNLVSGQTAPAYASGVTGAMIWAWDTAISKWVLVSKA